MLLTSCPLKNQSSVVFALDVAGTLITFAFAVFILLMDLTLPNHFNPVMMLHKNPYPAVFKSHVAQTLRIDDI